MISDIGRNLLRHRSHRKVCLVRTQHRESVAAGDVVQLEPDSGVVLRKLAHRLWQDVQNGGLPRCNVERTAFELSAARGEGFGKRVHALHQRQCQLVENRALRCELDLRTAALEQRRAEITFERLNLQRHGWLAQKQPVGRPGDTAGLRRRAKGTQLLEAILLVVDGVD